MRRLGSLSACALLVAMFLPWYEIHGGALGRLVLASSGNPVPPTGDAWEALGSVRLLLFGLVLIALIPAALVATGQATAAARAARVVVASAIATGLVVLYRLIDQPGADAVVDVRYGAYLGLAAVCVIGLSAWSQARGDVAASAVADRRPAGDFVEGAARPGGWVAASLIGVALAAAFVAFFRLGTATWHFDEYFYSLLGQRFLSGQFDPRPGPHPYVGVYLIGVIPRVTGSNSSAAIRIAPALAGLATGAVLFLFARRIAGLRAGIVALATWALVPHATVMAGVALTDLRIERFALFDVFMEAFVAAALYTGWRWTQAGSWRWAAATGVLAGLAASCKVIGAYVLIPVWLLAIVTPGRDRRRLAQTALLTGLCPVVLALSFAPVLPEAHARFVAMLDLARENEAAGHLTIIAGHVYGHAAPWWANGWFLWKGVGPPATVALVGAAMIGAAGLERRLAIYLATAALLPLVALAGYSISLPHYYYVALAPLSLLAALGMHDLTRRRPAGAVVAGVLAVLLAVSAGTTIAGVARTEPGDYRQATAELRAAGLERGRIAVLGYAAVLCAYLPHAHFDVQATAASDAVVIDPLQSRRLDPYRVQRFVAAHRDGFRAMAADRLRVYVSRDSAQSRPASSTPPRASPVDCYAS
jgi:4-amino-4-deoxy-L-arabinose transferase-like glycosyltransferase